MAKDLGPQSFRNGPHIHSGRCGNGHNSLNGLTSFPFSFEVSFRYTIQEERNTQIEEVRNAIGDGRVGSQIG
jgi:hypothetical protein